MHTQAYTLRSTPHTHAAQVAPGEEPSRRRPWARPPGGLWASSQSWPGRGTPRPPPPPAPPTWRPAAAPSSPGSGQSPCAARPSSSAGEPGPQRAGPAFTCPALPTWAGLHHPPRPALLVLRPSAGPPRVPPETATLSARACMGAAPAPRPQHLALILRGGGEEPRAVLLADVDDLEGEDVVGRRLLSRPHHPESSTSGHRLLPAHRDRLRTDQPLDRPWPPGTRSSSSRPHAGGLGACSRGKHVGKGGW